MTLWPSPASIPGISDHQREQLAAVEFREIEGLEGYAIGSNGMVLSCWSNGGKKTGKWKVVKTDSIKGGYLRVTLRASHRKYKRLQVSHLVLVAFVGQQQGGMVACHWDGNVKNNAISNLRWGTRKENEEDKKRHGTHQTGEGNPAAKLTEEEVFQIRKLFAERKSGCTRIGRMFGVSKKTVQEIGLRQTWRHLQ